MFPLQKAAWRAGFFLSFSRRQGSLLIEIMTIVTFSWIDQSVQALLVIRYALVLLS